MPHPRMRLPCDEMRRLVLGVLVLVLAVAFAQPSAAARLAPIGSFNSPTFVVARGSNIFVVERAGRVVRLHKGARSTFGDLTGRVQCCSGERGLLSMAFDPSWKTNRRVYFFYVDNRSDLIVARWRANAAGTHLVRSTFHRLLRVPHRTYDNHNGGQLAFGPDGKLYVGTGDGGGGCDPFENGQDLSSRLGKVLRINPATGAVSVFMYGVRNPWRFSFDRKTGDFWLGDVGQSTQEEVDFRRSTMLHPAHPWNGGWDVWEGRVNASASGCDGTGLNSTGTLVHPLSVYRHVNGNCSITGGYVYRGRRLSIRGWYVFGDFCSGRIWRLRRHTDGSTTRKLLMDTSLSISSFGRGANGGILVADLNGTVYRLAPS
jgi:hypothetical protein